MPTERRKEFSKDSEGMTKTARRNVV